MGIIPILAALAAAGVGAGLWAAITVATNFEIGYMAWAVGALVGLAATYTGGRGKQVAAICAVLALLGILGGKILTVEHFVGKQIDPGNLLSATFQTLGPIDIIFAILGIATAYRLVIRAEMKDLKSP